MTAPDFRSVRPTSGSSPVVAITGARGYLGSVLVAAFEDAGCVVRPLVRAPVAGSSDRYFDLRTRRNHRCPGRRRHSRALRLRHDPDRAGRHLASERPRQRGSARPGGRGRRAAHPCGVVDVGVQRDAPTLRAFQVGGRGRSSGPRDVRGPSGSRLRTRLGRHGRDAATPGWTTRLARLRSRCTPVHRLAG